MLLKRLEQWLSTLLKRLEQWLSTLLKRLEQWLSTFYRLWPLSKDSQHHYSPAQQ